MKTLGLILFGFIGFVAHAESSLKQKVWQMHLNLEDLYLVPEYWDIPPQLIKPFRENLYVSLNNEVKLPLDLNQTATPAQVQQDLVKAKIIMLGDAHNDVKRHMLFADIIERVAKAATTKLIATVEIIGPKHQGVLDQFIAGGMSVEQLKTAIDFDHSDFRIYPFEGYAKILSVLQKYKIKALAVYKPEGVHYADLKTREAFVYETVKKEFDKDKNARLLLVYGGWHFLGNYTLTDRFAPEYRNQMIHYFSGFTFPPLRILLTKPQLQQGVFLRANYKNIKTYYQTIGFQPANQTTMFTDFFEYMAETIQDPAVKQKFLARAPIMVETYKALMESFKSAPPATSQRLYSLFCVQFQDLERISNQLFSADAQYKAVYAPRLHKLAQCQ